MEKKTFTIVVMDFSGRAVTVYRNQEIEKNENQDWTDAVEEFIEEQEHRLNDVSYMFDDKIEIIYQD